MQLIADILSFKVSRDKLSEQLQNTTIDWDAVVMIGSQYLVLPALFCRLQEKNLLTLIPEDLKQYLEELTAINRNRNHVLLQEVREVSAALKKEGIDHVFIKGMALLAGDYFKDSGERMVGDIDILVAKPQLHHAFTILTACGYDGTVKFNYEQKNYRHLARQVSEDKFGAVELHGDILTHRSAHLLPPELVLGAKREIQGIPIPAAEDAVRIAVLAFQMNDKAYQLAIFNFKTIYDCLVLNLPENEKWLEGLSEERQAQAFLQVASIFFNELKPYNTSLASLIRKGNFQFRLRHPKAGHRLYSFQRNILATKDRLGLLLHNKSYRNHILKNKIGLRNS